MPFADSRDWDGCVQKRKQEGHDEESAKRICGYLKKKTEDSDEESE